eukprot:2195438-Rhodomonas_salina.4
MCVCVCLVWLRACLTEGGGWKQARACEEDADQSRVAMALEVQEQVSGELASATRMQMVPGEERERDATDGQM